MRYLMFLAVAFATTACSSDPTGDDNGSTLANGASDGSGVTTGDYDPGENANATIEVNAFIGNDSVACNVLLDGQNAGETGTGITVASGEYNLNLGTYASETWDGLPTHSVDNVLYVASTLDLTVTAGDNVLGVWLVPYFDYETGADCHLVTGDGWEEDYPLEEPLALADGSTIDAEAFIGGTIEFQNGTPYLYGLAAETSGTNDIVSLTVTSSTLEVVLPGFVGNDTFTCTAR